MNLPSFQVRRGTVDDLQQLVPLWESVRSTEPGLERRVTEFQVIEDGDGRLLGILGLETAGRQGKLHTEAFVDFSQADQLRELLWARTQSVAHNHGVTRIWTAETAPFWTHNGFQAANGETLAKIPPAWGQFHSHWLTIQLRDEVAVESSLDRDFERLRQEARRETQRAQRLSRILNWIILIVVIALFIGALLYAIHLHKTHYSPG
jgi:N-acetylglutamate synthase-like GNAT family acetyltransferase